MMIGASMILMCSLMDSLIQIFLSHWSDSLCSSIYSMVNGLRTAYKSGRTEVEAT